MKTVEPSEPSMFRQRMDNAVGERLYDGLYGLAVYKADVYVGRGMRHFASSNAGN